MSCCMHFMRLRYIICVYFESIMWYIRISVMLLQLMILSGYFSTMEALSWTTISTQKGTNAMKVKQSFYTALDTKPQVAKQINTIVNELTSLNTIKIPKRLTSLGKWRVVWAPHINALQKLTFTSFDVTYSFSPKIENTLVSNVVYSSPIFGRGHLNTEGIIRLNQDNTECYIVWDKIWWDLSIDQPTTSSDIRDHMLPKLIQTIGNTAFIESVSRFPIQFADEDTCVFLFEALGTRICAKKLAPGNTKLSQGRNSRVVVDKQEDTVQAEEVSIFTQDGNLQLGPYIQAKLGRKVTAVLALILTSPYLLFAIRGLLESGML